MSRGELTDAYVRGRISRRSFVRGMVALGASATTAMAMADSLSAAPGGAPAVVTSDVYDDPDPPKDPDGETAGGETVYTLPSTGVGNDAGSSAVPVVVAATAAAAAVVALRARQGKKVEDEA